ncbi:ATP synthase subunit I [Sulfuritalea hydrogenivorans]|jgi:ATP synthase protein I|uniref:ATP synthase subunit I n=1 Tax=Sulfuritalea hydrogenivorans TaxID=748811 RepID=UPI000597AEC8|nr:ATP synthase subunit I [Sulfuritalea hydrogenivorans]MDK9715715.1 ATP synthase subunit I [Sulfuritalea sp.]
MFKAVFHQGIATLIVAGLAWLWAGPHGAASAGLGGAAVVIPNLFFALSLWAAARSGRASVARFFVGEFIKVAATLALLVIVAGAYRDLHWLALLAGLLVALKANLFAILIKA